MVNDEIIDLIKRVEKKYSVKIVWAIESGSRAWGFASEDSDYDIRCMHVASEDSYLGLFPPPPQINIVEGNFDLESWDIKKFGELSIKSNPQIAEWLRSPVVYIDSPIRAQFRRYFDEGCSLKFLKQHYIRMAKQNYHKYMGIGMSHSCKKYLYVLRGIACARYIEKENKIPPLPYKEVIPYLPEYAQRFFEKCVIQKNLTEKKEILSEEQVSSFIDNSINKDLRGANIEFGRTKELNEYIVKTIKELG